MYGSTDGSILFPYFRTVRKYESILYEGIDTFVLSYEDTLYFRTKVPSYEGTSIEPKYLQSARARAAQDDP
jgi:hypothetical protein